MIGIIGDSNSGKSTLLNALLGQKLLPQSYKSCTSTVTLATLSTCDAPTMSYLRAGQVEHVEGRRDIHSRIKVLNEEIRGHAEMADVMTLALKTRGRRELLEAGVCDGQMQLVDMPGQDESDNPVVKQCLKQLLARCHGLFIMVKHDAIKSDRLAVLVDSLIEQAPHLFRTEGALTFIISQVDTVRIDDDEQASDEDSDEWEEIADEAAQVVKAIAQAAAREAKKAKVLKDLKRELRRYLAHRDGLLLFPSFVREVRVLATSVDSKNQGGHEFGQILDVVKDLHLACRALRLARKVQLCEDTYMTFCDMLLDVRPRHPARAEQVLKAESDEQNLKKTLTAISAVSFVVTLPLGGWGAAVGCAIRLSAAGAALGVGAATSFVANSDVAQKIVEANSQGSQMIMTGGERQHMSGEQLGAIGAEESNRRIEFTISTKAIKEGHAYEDTLLNKDNSPLYIGAFKNNLPQGQGRVFWPSTNFEAFIGEFSKGLPKEGIFFNEKGFFTGRMRVGETGHLEAVGQQDDEDEAYDPTKQWEEEIEAAEATSPGSPSFSPPSR